MVELGVGRGRFGAVLLSAVVFGTGVVLAPPAHAEPPVAVWLTTKDGAHRLERLPDVAFGSGGGNPTIVVDPGATFQQVDGFGAALTDSAASLVNGSPQRDEIMTGLFDPRDGIGLSAVRQVVGSSDFARSTYSYDLSLIHI